MIFFGDAYLSPCRFGGTHISCTNNLKLVGLVVLNPFQALLDSTAGHAAVAAGAPHRLSAHHRLSAYHRRSAHHTPQALLFGQRKDKLLDFDGECARPPPPADVVLGRELIGPHAPGPFIWEVLRKLPSVVVPKLRIHAPLLCHPCPTLFRTTPSVNTFLTFYGMLSQCAWKNTPEN